MRKAQLSSVTRGETRIKPKRWWGERCEEERLLGVPCLSISSITALILCSVTFTRGLVGELGALLGCCTGESVPGGSGRTRTPVPESQPGSCLRTLMTARKGFWLPAFPGGAGRAGGKGRWVRQGRWCLHSSSGGGGKVPRPRAWKQKQEVREEEE